MRLKIYFYAIALALTCACHREQPPQYIAGFISEIESEQLIAIDSMGSGIIYRFTIDENTQYQSSGLIEGNVAEVMYIPTEEELKAFQEASQPVYKQMVDEGICTQEEMDEMLAIVAAAK